MTTEAAERLYESQHVATWEGVPLAVYNPHGKLLADLPVIYGFCNGGRPGWMQGILFAEDGTHLGGHLCSSEAYMPSDLGCLEGSATNRHAKDFQPHYPDGYRMEFVPGKEVLSHAGLTEAYRLNQEWNP